MIATVNQIAQAWWGWMGSMLWQVSLLILIVTALDFVLRRWAWPQVRYALWLLVLIKLIIPPTWTLPSSLMAGWRPLAQARIEERLDIGQRASTISETVQRSPIVLDATTASIPAVEPVERSAQAQPAVSSSPPPRSSLAWKAIAMLAWILGMGIFVALLAHRISRLRRWHKMQVKKKTIPVWYYELLVETIKRLKLGRLPAIVFSQETKAPAVYGMFRPVLLLPASYLDSLSKEDAEHVLLHELAHLKRGDLWLHGLCLLLQIVYWFNPLLIWTRRQMKHVREICCDLTIANVLKEKTMKYRETLINTARELLTETAEPGMGLLGVFEDPFRLVARLRWLEKKTWHTRKLMTFTVLIVMVVMTAAVLPMGRVGQESPSSTLKQQADFKEVETERVKNLRLDVKIKMTSPLYAAVLPRIGQLDEFERAFARMKQLLDEAGIRPTGPPFGRYISDGKDVPMDEFVWEIGYPVAPGTEVEPPLEIIRMSEQQVACATIEGIKSTEAAWRKFAEAVKSQGYIPAGPPFLEIWQGGPEGKEFWWKTEMQIQAFSLEEGYPGMDISFKETEPFTALVLPMQSSYSQLSAGAKLLREYIAEKGIKTTGLPFGRYFTDSSKVPPSRYKWEIGYPVAEGIVADAPFMIRTIEGAKVAYAILPGPPEPDYPWASFILQIIIKGHLPALPATEIWHGDPAKTGAEGPRMELQIPVVSPGDIAATGREGTSGEKANNKFTLKKLGQVQGRGLGAVSPDGGYISFVDWTTGDLAVRNLSTGEEKRLTDKGPWTQSGAMAFHSRWSADGRKIAYDWWDWDQKPGFVGVRVIGLEEHVPRTVYQVSESETIQTFAWSSEGRQLLVLQSQGPPQKWTGRIALVRMDDGSARVLKTLDLSRIAYNKGINMDLSPDGRFIAYHIPVGGNALNQDIMMLSVEGLEDIPLVEHPANDSLLGFAPDGGHVLFTSDRRGSMDIWMIPVSNGRATGAAERLTVGTGDIEPLGFTVDGAFYFETGGPEQNVYIAELDPNTGMAAKVTQEPIRHIGRGSGFPAYSPDGRMLAYVSNRGGPRGDARLVICIRSLDSGKEREFFPDYDFFQGLKWSPDSRRLLARAFDDRDRSAHSLLAVIDAETGEIRLLKKCDRPRLDQEITASDWSKDGRTIFYVLNTKSQKSSQLLIRELESGSEKELYRAPAWAERFLVSRSPDGKWLALMNDLEIEGEGKTLRKMLRIISADGKEIRDLTTFEVHQKSGDWTTWTPDGKYVLFLKPVPLEEGKSRLWRIPVQGGEPEMLNIEMWRLSNLTIHPDGSRLAFGSYGPSWKEPELWMMENFLPASAKEK